MISLRDIKARNIIFAKTGIRSLEHISLKGVLSWTNVFVTIPKDADEELIAAITNTQISELASKVAVSPAERAAREAERIRLGKQLEEANTILEGFTRLLTADKPPYSYLARDLENIKLWKDIIDKHLSTAGLYSEAINSRAMNSMPRITLDAVWYRLSRFNGMNFTPETIPTRFNPGRGHGSFKSMALAEDVSTAMFELTNNVDLAGTCALLRELSLTQIRVTLTNVADLTDPATVKSVLGIDFGALVGVSFPGALSVTQKICAILAQSGSEGAIFPSRTTIGRKNLVVFPNNLPSGTPLIALLSRQLQTQ